MKPSWDDAPEWAQWLAMDDNGAWYWYEKKPLRLSSAWMAAGGSKIDSAELKDRKDTLEKRA